MDLALNIVTQASVQIALFVTPILVLLSFPMGHPLDLVFSTFELMSVVLAVAIVAYLVLNGETNWFEGVQLLALYAMIAVAIHFLPRQEYFAECRTWESAARTRPANSGRTTIESWRSSCSPSAPCDGPTSP